VDTITIKRNGLILTGPAKPKRDAYIRVSVVVDGAEYDVTDGPVGDRRHEVWSEAVSLAYSVYGAAATEDNTVGQLAQVDGADGRKRNLPCRGRVFSLGLNLWGKPARKLHERIAAVAAGK
jgi:hypothetical protein